MILDTVMPYLGPVIVICNITTTFFCLKPKRGLVFTVCLLAAWILSVHIFIVTVPGIHPLVVRFVGVAWLPLLLFLFKGHPFQIAFAMFLSYQLGSLTTHIADALVGAIIGYHSPNAIAYYLAISLILLSVYMTIVLKYGRRIFERIFIEGKSGSWALYTIGIIFSCVLIIAVDWRTLGAPMYFALILFILWSIGVLCFTIINTHEKAAQEHEAEMMALQMKAMREQTAAEKKHREDMEILRHDMRHEMGVIMELYRTGKAAQAEAMYSVWQNELNEAVPALLCAEPMLNAVLTRFERRAKDIGVNLYVNSNVPGDLPIDTIKLSVMVANALENALAATGKVPEDDKRVIRVRLISSGDQIGLEVVNPCAAPVKFNEKGLPVTNEIGHGIGVRSIAAFAKDNDYMLDFSSFDSKFTMRLVMRLDAPGMTAI